MRTILMFVHILVSVGLIGLVLLQHGRGADAGAAFGSGASQTLFGARGSTSFLSRATAILAAVFFVTSLGLAYLTGQQHQRHSVTEIVAPATSDLPPLPMVPLSANKEAEPKEAAGLASPSIVEQNGTPAGESPQGAEQPR